MNSETARVITLDQLRMTDVAHVGGKNASLGEMIGRLAGAGIRVPGGFATTTAAFDEFLRDNDLTDKIAARLAQLDVENVAELAKAGSEVRRWITEAPFPQPLVAAIAAAYTE